MKHFCDFEPNRYYHIYNHAVGNENLFRTKENYLYFLHKYTEYIFPVCKSYAYILMPNHFHFLISVRDTEEIKSHYLLLENEKELIQPKFVMQQFSNFFNGYAKAYNKQYQRKGALFIDYLRRKPVNHEKYLSRLIYYIHNNAVHHGFCKEINDWEFSSYKGLLSEKNSKLEKEEVLKWFGNKEKLIKSHKGKSMQFGEMEIEELEFLY